MKIKNALTVLILVLEPEKLSPEEKEHLRKELAKALMSVQ
jgi:hypothetical protein